MQTAELLWKENEDLVEMNLNLPFVQGLGNDELDFEAFKGYVAQDAFFLDAFKQAYELARKKSNTDSDRTLFEHCIEGVSEELKLHKQYAEELGLDLANVDPMPACKEYTDFLMKTAQEKDVDEIVAAMAPCMSLYGYLGTQLKETTGTNKHYRNWINTYAGNDFSGGVAELESRLNKVKPEENIKQAYRFAMQCEVKFFENAYQLT